MSKYVVAIVSGFVVAFVVSFEFSALMTAAGESHSNTPLVTGLIMGAFTAYIMANLAGNRKVATADPAAKAQALAFTPPAGKALIYLYREGFVGKAAGLNVAVDGKVVAQLKSPRFHLRGRLARAAQPVGGIRGPGGRAEHRGGDAGDPGGG